MQRKRSSVAWYAAFIAAALFVAITMLVVPLFIGAQQFFDPEFYKRTLMEQGFYENFPELASEQLARAMSGGQGSLPYLKNLTQTQWEMILADLVPSTWLQSQTESLIDQFFAYLDSDQQDLTLALSMAEIKARLAGEAGTQAVINLLRAQPPCTFNDLMDLFFEGLFGGLENLPSCRPPEDLIREFRPALQTALGGLARGIPDEIDLGPMIEETITQATYGLVNDPRLAVKVLRLLINLSVLLPVGLLALITLFVVRSFYNWLLWWGIPFALAGITMLGSALVLSPLVNLLLIRFLVRSLPPGLSQGLVAVGSAIWGQLTRSLAVNVAWIAAGFLFVGLVMTAAGFVTWRLQSK